MCPSQSSRLEPAQGLDRPPMARRDWPCDRAAGSTASAIFSDFSLSRLIAGMLLDRRLSIGS
jgi:hypothetical protein